MNVFSIFGLFSVFLALAAPALAVNVGTDATQGSDTKAGQKIEDSKSINIKQGNTKKDSTGSEKRATQESRVEVKQSDDSTMETSAASLFIPIIQQIEHGGSNVADSSRAGKLIQSCRFYTKVQPVPTSMAAEIRFAPDNMGRYMEKAIRGGKNAAPGKWSGSTKIMLTGDWLTQDYEIYHQNSFIESVPARDMVQCYFAYGLTMQRAIKQLATGGRVQESALGEKIIVVRGDLVTEANNAIEKALNDPGLADEIARYTDNAIRGGCMLPTMAGVQQGTLDWSCGGLKVDPLAVVASMGAMHVIGDNTYMGIKLNFAQASGRSNVASNAKSKSKFSSSESARESGQELTQGKSKTTSQESGTTSGRSRKSDTSASPK